MEAEALDVTKNASMEEVRLAKECGDIDADGYPIITVAADGVWSNPSYRTNYSASPGVVAIIGFRKRRAVCAERRKKS